MKFPTIFSNPAKTAEVPRSSSSVVIFTIDAICINTSKRPSFHLSCCVGSCGAWGSWGSCSKTCGSGFKLRERKCPENSLHLKKQKTSCNTNLCPGQRKEA